MSKDTTNYKIFSELDYLKSGYEGTSLEKIGGLQRSQYKVIKMCEYYSDSRYLGELGNKRQIGRGQIDIPFYNIVNYRVALAKTATDLDIKDIQIVSDNPKYQVHSMLLNRECYEWMKKEAFSKTLNQMGHTRPKYGGYLIKKTEDAKKLNIDVVRWTNVLTDQNDILSGPIVEKHFMSPVAIKKKDKAWDNVKDVLVHHRKMKLSERPTAIEVQEITGEFPVAMFKNSQNEEGITEEDEYTYSLQHYFIANLDSKKFLLFAEELTGELTDYYEYLSWEDNGYGLGRGVIEDSEEAQVWTNDAVINEAISMTLAGRVGIKTNSKKLGNNILEHDFGKIYELGTNEDINAFNLAPSALGQYQNQIEKWRTQANDATSSYNAQTGEQPPSGTPYSQTALLNQVSSKPFDYKREEWGIHLTKIFDKWVIPYLIKKIRKEHILVSEFTDTELELIDESFATYNTNEDIKAKMKEMISVSPEEQSRMTEGYKDNMKKNGKKRFIEIPEDYFKDMECKVTVITTGEQKNKAVILQSLNEILGTVIKSYNPQTGTFGVLTDPALNKIFKEIVELAGTGVSPISLGRAMAPAVPTQPTAPVEAGPVTTASPELTAA